MAPSLPAALCRPPRSQGGHSLFSHGPVYPGGFARFLCLKYSLLTGPARPAFRGCTRHHHRHRHRHRRPGPSPTDRGLQWPPPMDFT